MYTNKSNDLSFLELGMSIQNQHDIGIILNDEVLV